MPVVQHRVEEVSAVNRIPSDLLNPRALAFFEDHSIKELVTFFHTDVFSHDVVNVVVRVEHFNFDMKQSGFAFDPYEISGLFVKQFSVDINLHL